jgi:ABC-type glycerol-3-phosphate transport system substrate-binding protein
MKKRKVLAAVMALLMAVMLAACSSSSSEVTSGGNGATFKLKNLPKNEFVETQAKFNFDDAVITVELEGGTVDIEIIDIVPDEGDTDSYTEMGTLYEGKDLADGEVIEVSGVRTNVIVRVYGGDATGTVTIAQKE